MSDTTEKRDLVFTRVFDAPFEQVWKAWVDPEMVRQWWGLARLFDALGQVVWREFENKGGEALQ